MQTFPVSPVHAVETDERGNAFYFKREDLLPFSFGVLWSIFRLPCRHSAYFNKFFIKNLYTVNFFWYNMPIRYLYVYAHAENLMR